MLYLLSILLLICFFSCSKAKNEIPITTASKAALEEFLKGRELFDDYRLAESIPYFEKAVALDTNFATAYYYLGQAASYDNIDRFVQNQEKAKLLADKVSEGERNQILMLQAYFEGNVPKQKELSEKLITAFPKDKRVLLNMAGFYSNLRDYAKASEYYQKAIDLDPKYAPAYNQLAYNQLYAENLPEAEKAIKKYVRLKPKEPNPYDSFAEILMKEGKFEESIENYRKALELNPDFNSAYVGIATNCILLNKPEEARKEMQTLLDRAKMDGAKQTAIYTIANSYIDEGNYPKALETMQQSFEISLKNKDILSQSFDLSRMGDILRVAGKLKEAENSYMKGFQIVRQSDLSAEIKKDAEQDLFNSQAELALKKGDLKTAKSCADKILAYAESKQNPGRLRSFHFLTGRIALAKKQYDNALSEFRQANQTAPYVLRRMAEAYEGKGDKAKARECWDKTAHYNANDAIYMFERKLALKKLEELK